MNEYLSLLRNNRNYRNLWLGNVVSLLGDWFNLLASAELITDLTNSGTAVSYLFLARFLPLFFFSPLAGVLADRYSRRGIMIASDVLRALTVLGFLLVRISSQIWLLYALTITQFILSAMFTPARSAILANVVPQKDLVAANALDSFTWSTMLALGSFLGGLVAAIFGADTAFVADVATFLLSAFFVSQITGVARAQEAGRQGGWLDFVDGFRYLRGAGFILGISLVKAGGSLVWGAINVLEIKFAEQVFPIGNTAVLSTLHIEDAGTATLGIIYMMSGLGTGLGPLAMRRWLGDAPSRLLTGVTIGFGLMAVGIISLGLAPTLPLFLLATLLRTVGTGTIWVFSAAMLQTWVPDRYRGRVFAFEFAALTLTQSISIYWAGFAQDNLLWIVNRVAMATGLFGLVVGGIWLIFYLGNVTAVKQMQPSEQ